MGSVRRALNRAGQLGDQRWPRQRQINDPPHVVAGYKAEIARLQSLVAARDETIAKLEAAAARDHARIQELSVARMKASTAEVDDEPVKRRRGRPPKNPAYV